MPIALCTVAAALCQVIQTCADTKTGAALSRREMERVVPSDIHTAKEGAIDG